MDRSHELAQSIDDLEDAADHPKTAPVHIRRGLHLWQQLREMRERVGPLEHAHENPRDVVEGLRRHELRVRHAEHDAVDREGRTRRDLSPISPPAMAGDRAG
jgi:hypothetical protein